VNWNSTDYLKRCLASLHKDAEALDGEIIVVDNCSKENPTEMLKRDFPYVKALINTENKGYASANNQGIRSASGKYVFLLNPDTEIIDDALRGCRHFLLIRAARKDNGIVSG